MSKYYRLVIAVITLAMVITISGSLAEAATIHVDDDYATPVNSACGERTGASDDPYCMIQDAIDASVDGDTVLVHDGTYVENINFNGRAITVKSKNGADVTTIDGNQSGSVVVFDSGEGSNSVLEGFMLTNGSGTNRGDGRFCGGGIFCKTSSPTIINCIVTGNVVPWDTSDSGGGGIYCYDGSSPSIVNCMINNNTVLEGGGIKCVDSSPTITNCSINNNFAAGSGGGIACYEDSSPTITNCSIISNWANAGGGIKCEGSAPYILNCMIAGNRATGTHGWGGGIQCESTSVPPVLMNCIIAGNTALLGGGIANEYYSVLDVINSTITGNLASTSGGAIWLWNSSSITMRNSILWGNAGPGDSNEIDLGNGNSITISYSIIDTTHIVGDGTKSFSNNLNADPLFILPINALDAPTASGDFHLQAGSPCIDKGTSSGAPTNDIEGIPRPQDGDGLGAGSTGDGSDYDIGAYEYSAVTSISIILNSGWNLISLCVEPEDTDIATVLNTISGKYIKVWAFQNGAWQVYDPEIFGFNNLTTMEARWGYWLNMSEAATLAVSGSTPSNSISLVSGWNLVGYNSCEPQPVADALASCDEKYVSVWAYINGAWKVYDPANPGFSDLTTMEPNYGYWIKTTEACTWTMP